MSELLGNRVLVAALVAWLVAQSIKIAVDLFPAQESARVAGTYVIKNKTDKPVTAVYLNLPAEVQFQKLAVGGVAQKRVDPSFVFDRTQRRRRNAQPDRSERVRKD